MIDFTQARGGYDSITRAVAELTGKDYDEIRASIETLAAGNLSKHPLQTLKSKACQAYLKSLGIVKVKRGPGACPTYTEAHERFGNCIVVTREHVSAIVDGALREFHDTRTYHKQITPWQSERVERKAQSIYVLND